LPAALLAVLPGLLQGLVHLVKHASCACRISCELSMCTWQSCQNGFSPAGAVTSQQEMLQNQSKILKWSFAI